MEGSTPKPTLLAILGDRGLQSGGTRLGGVTYCEERARNTGSVQGPPCRVNHPLGLISKAELADYTVDTCRLLPSFLLRRSGRRKIDEGWLRRLGGLLGKPVQQMGS
jgi:hypothetical protein